MGYVNNNQNNKDPYGGNNAYNNPNAHNNPNAYGGGNAYNNPNAHKTNNHQNSGRSIVKPLFIIVGIVGIATYLAWKF